MSTSTGFLTTREPPKPELALPAIVDLLASTVSSAEPAVVFSSIAQRCVPRLCLQATIAISEAGARTYLISHPLEPADPQERTGSGGGIAFGGIKVTDDVVFTDIRGDSSESYSAYEGVLAMRFAHSASSQALLGQLIVAHATALIHTERLSHVAQVQRSGADSLEAGIRASREIGMAMGIVMKFHTISEQHAFDLLRLISRDTHREIRDIALDIMDAGDIGVFPGLLALSHPGPARLLDVPR